MLEHTLTLEPRMRTIIAIASLFASVSSECCTYSTYGGQKFCIDCPDEHCCAPPVAGYLGNPPVCCSHIALPGPNISYCSNNATNIENCKCTDDRGSSVCCPSGKACVASFNFPGTHECCADAGMVCCVYEDSGGCCPQDKPDCCNPIKAGVEELAA